MNAMDAARNEGSAERADARGCELDRLARAIRECERVIPASWGSVTVKPVPDAASNYHGLDPRVRARLERRAAARGEDGAAARFSLRNARRAPVYATTAFNDSVEVEERLVDIDGTHRIDVFIVRPHSLESGRPVLVYLHGGGFHTCGFSWQEPQMRAIAARSGCTVVYPEYRLAPECPFPGPVRDAWGAVRWVCDHAAELGIDAARIVVGGDSAGASLANACALLDRDGVICRLFEVYPSFDWRRYEDQQDYTWSLDCYDIAPGERELIEPRILGIKRCRERRAGTPVDLYFRNDGDVCDPLASVLCASDEALAAFPPLTVALAEYDYLRVMGGAALERFARLGVEVSTYRYEGVDHGFFDKWESFAQARELAWTIADELAALSER